MKRALVVLAAALLLVLEGRTASVQAAQKPARIPCVFTNPAFAGKCTETPKEPETCESILRCLNDVACLKTYCQATTIRQGWKLEPAK